MQNERGRNPKSRKKIQRNLPNRIKIGKGALIQVISLGMFIFVMALLLIFPIGKERNANAQVNGAVETGLIESEALEYETPETVAVSRELKIENLTVTGLSREEAEKKILAAYEWGIQLSYGNLEKTIDNPLPGILDSLLDEIYSKEEALREEQYYLDVALAESDIRKQVQAIASKWNRKPVSAQLTGRDKENGSWIYAGGENGIKINEEAAVRAIMDKIWKRDFNGTIAVQAQEIAPEFSEKEIKEKYQVIGTFSTTATDNKNRNNNISLAVNALDGLVIFPGEEFSFNEATGNRTRERGYMPAGAYRNGEFVEEPGGGVCQVSSTLYNSIIFSGIKTTERHPHSFEPSYVTPGEDAMVSYDGYSGPDLRFVNTSDTSVALRAVFDNKKLTVSVIGIPILDEGTKVAMRSEKIKEYEPPMPNYEEDQTLQPGQETVIKEGKKGTTWKTWLVTTKDGKTIDEEYFHTSTYKGKAGVVKRNTSGVVIPPEAETADAPTPGEDETMDAPIQQEEIGPENAIPEPLAPETEPEMPPPDISQPGPGSY